MSTIAPPEVHPDYLEIVSDALKYAKSATIEFGAPHDLKFRSSDSETVLSHPARFSKQHLEEIVGDYISGEGETQYEGRFRGDRIVVEFMPDSYDEEAALSEAMEHLASDGKVEIFPHDTHDGRRYFEFDVEPFSVGFSVEVKA